MISMVCGYSEHMFVQGKSGMAHSRVIASTIMPRAFADSVALVVCFDATV